MVDFGNLSGIGQRRMRLDAFGALNTVILEVYKLKKDDK